MERLPIQFATPLGVLHSFIQAGMADSIHEMRRRFLALTLLCDPGRLKSFFVVYVFKKVS